MTESRELAEKAFSLLQNALKDSEQRVAELDAELKQKNTPRNKGEQQAQVLQHRIDSLTAESQQWQEKAKGLEEVLENERVKAQRLQKKLELAESGPNKVDKKEVNFWRARAEQMVEETQGYKNRIAELKKSLKQNSQPLEKEISALEQRIEELEAEREVAARQAADIQALTEERDALVREKEDLAAETTTRIQAAERERDERLETLKAEADGFRATLAELETQTDDLKERNSQLNSDLADNKTELSEKTSQLQAKFSELNEKEDELAARGKQIESYEEQIAERDREIDKLKQEISESETRLSELSESAREAQEENDRIREQIAGLEEELKEEKDCTVNLGEIANERHEQITELSEKLEEAEEHYEEAKWRLEKAQRFERLLNKRQKLIASLIDGQRAKQKSNNALKAGIDGLRRFKAKSEAEQQKLLLRIDELSSALRQAEERIAKGESTKLASEKLRKAEMNVEALEERLSAQVQVIENLESELNAAKAARKVDDQADNQNNEVDELKAAMELKDQTIQQLEADLNEQQQQLGRLRGSESETMRLKAVQVQDQSMIDELTAQVEGLKQQLRDQETVATDNIKEATAGVSSDIRKKDSQIADLKRANKDLEREVARLNEAVAGWQKKYEFLSTEAPSAYQSVAAEK